MRHEVWEAEDRTGTVQEAMRYFTDQAITYVIAPASVVYLPV